MSLQWIGARPSENLKKGAGASECILTLEQIELLSELKIENKMEG